MGNAEKIGWLFFVLGSVVFTMAGLVNGDWWTFGGGMLYVVGCAALLQSATQGRDA
ncbi:MAG: hypothetical protein AAGC53_17115 [Actinomycetota bacterium]